MATTGDYVRLSKHVLLRGMLVGSTLGLVAGTGVAVVNKRDVAAVGRRFALTGCVVGAGFSAVMLAKRLLTLEDVSTGVMDRSFRLLHNKGQNHVDACVALGFVAASGYGAYTTADCDNKQKLALRSMRFGVVGMVAGVVASVVIRTFQRKLLTSDV